MPRGLGHDLSRRRLLRGAGAVAFGGASVAVLPLFGTDGAEQDPATCWAADLPATDQSLVVSTWPAYIDPRTKKTSTASVFSGLSGISVDDTDDVDDDVDLMVLTDWTAARMISLGWV